MRCIQSHVQKKQSQLKFLAGEDECGILFKLHLEILIYLELERILHVGVC